MCGIAGLLMLNGERVARSDLKRLSDALAHRGPDGEGGWSSDDQSCRLAHRRLAILDVEERADQPMISGTGDTALVFNGEIYNFLEVRAELEAMGHSFHTESDTEVVLTAWAAWGEAMLPRFNGMWALAIYDRKTGELFLARDRFGVKPLLYSESSDCIAFASEMRALLSLPAVSNDLDPTAVKRVLFDPFSLEASESTIYASIKRIPAGHHLRISATKRTLTRWWNTSEHLAEVPDSLDRAATRFWDQFREAVRIRMRSDVPIGTCLSGGFDSSAIVATMADLARDQTGNHERESKDWRHAFIASFPGMSNDETREARMAAAYADIDAPVILDCSGDEPLDDIDAVLDTLEDIFIGLPTAVWKTYRAVNEHGVRVTIDGHGADEIMGGYRQGGQALQFLLRNLFGNASGRHPAIAGVNDVLKSLYLRSKKQYFLRDMTPPKAFPVAANNDRLPKHWGLVNRRLYGMVHATILPTLLRNFDRLSMAHSVEVRSPFLDWRLVTSVLALPDAMKSDQEYSKVIAREAMRGRMPEEIRAATRKIGFGSQMPEWLNGKLGQWAANQLAEPNAEYDALVDSEALRARVLALNTAGGWDWEVAGRLWPYIHLRWLIARREAQRLEVAAVA